MPITRDADFPVEAAQLMQSFNHCAEGHSSVNVLEAAANMLIAAIGYHVKRSDGDLEQAVGLAHEVAKSIEASVVKNWERKSIPTDITVHHGN